MLYGNERNNTPGMVCLNCKVLDFYNTLFPLLTYYAESLTPDTMSAYILMVFLR